MLLFYIGSAERNMVAFKREFERQMKARENLSDIKTAMLRFTALAEIFGDLTDWMQTAPEAAWVTRDEEEEAGGQAI